MKKTFDNSGHVPEGFGVQQTWLRRIKTLDSRDQRPLGLLNTHLKRCDTPWSPLGNLPHSEKSGRGLFVLLNRSIPVGNAPTPLRRIVKRIAKHGRRDYQTNKPACLKRPQPHMATERGQMLRVVPALMGLGFRLVKVCRRHPKRIRLVSSDDSVQAQAMNSCGFVVCVPV